MNKGCYSFRELIVFFKGDLCEVYLIFMFNLVFILLKCYLIVIYIMDLKV